MIGIDPADVAPPRPPIATDGPEVVRLGSSYIAAGQLSEDEWVTTVHTAARTLWNSPHSAAREGRATGLALGKIQSGKTTSYTALIALAVDNGYRVTVVLAGTKIPLLEQTYARLVRDLGAGRQGLTSFRNPVLHDAEVMRSVLHSGGHVLIVVLKNRRRIEGVTQLLASPELRRYPCVIIDDEGDEASLNTQFRTGTQSPVYRSILQLRDALPLHTFVAYTATPQANLLISGFDALAPDFAILVEPGQGYCGGSIFFGEHSERYVRVIPVHEAAPERATEIVDPLRNAIAVFLVGTAIQSIRSGPRQHSMLLHTSNLRADHHVLHEAVGALISLWKDMVTLPETDPSLAEFHVLAEQAYRDLSQTVADQPTWERVRQQLRDEVWLTETWMVNSLPLGRDPITMPFRLRNNILVGGNMLGRGVTLEGLTVTYITREAKNDTNADTLEQRARWFGYKQEYLDVCRIFLTERLRARYTELLRHEDDFWDALRRNDRQGLPARDWPRMFRLDMESWQLRPTRPSVARYRGFRGSGWETQRRLIADPMTASHNAVVARRFFDNHPGELRKFGNVEHRVVSGCHPESVVADLLAPMEMVGTGWDKSYVEEYLMRLHLGGLLDGIDVLLMGDGRLRERSPDDGGSYNPMQGRSPHREPGEADFYPGDENIHDGRLQLQVHLIHMLDANRQLIQDTTALAFYVPNDPRYDLRVVVRDES